MPSEADTTIALTIGIDTGKNTLHVIGLDESRRARTARKGISDADCRTILRYANRVALLASKPAWPHTT